LGIYSERREKFKRQKWLAVVNFMGTSLAIPNEKVRRTMGMVPGVRREVPALGLCMGTAVGPVKA
jgi:hypothetical protein